MIPLLVLLACRPILSAGDGGGSDGGGSDGGGNDGGGPGDGGAPGEPETPWDPDHLYRVEVEMDPADWDSLRSQERNIVQELVGDCMQGPFESPYTWFTADLFIDGLALPRVAIKKKGLVGSASTSKPGLRFDLDEEVENQRYLGAEHLTLNNAVQDPSMVRQCLGYSVFADAGYPAPRCAFAKVSVNGEDLGVYVSVEPVRSAFLEDRFGDADGALFEGTLSDFREGWTLTFDPDSDAAEASRASIEAVVAALQVPDDALLAELGAVIDLDAFTTSWALDALVGQWDGYAGNTNNFYIYQRPSDSRIAFLPWGMDAAFSAVDFPGLGHAHVMATAALPNRLYTVPEARAAYLDRLQALLTDTWDAERLRGRVASWSALIADEVQDPDAFEDGLDLVDDFIEEQPRRLQEELDQGPASIGPDELSDLPCLVRRGEVQARFSTTWGSLDSADPWGEGQADLTIVLDGNALPLDLTTALAGPLDGEPDAGLFVVGLIEPDTVLAPYLRFDSGRLSGPGTLAVDWQEVQGYLGYAEGGSALQVGAYLWDGELVLDAAGSGEGDAVEGSLEVGIWAGAE